MSHSYHLNNQTNCALSIYYIIAHNDEKVNPRHSALHWGESTFCCAFQKNYYNHSDKLDSGSFIGYNGFTIKLMEVHSYVKNT